MAISEINLATSEKQDSILSKLDRIVPFENLYTECITKTSSNTVANEWETILEVSGSGALRYVGARYNYSSSPGSVYLTFRITIDDNEPVLVEGHESSRRTSSCVILLSNVNDIVVSPTDNVVINRTDGSSFSSNGGRLTSPSVNGSPLPIDFNYLKVECMFSSEYVDSTIISGYSLY